MSKNKNEEVKKDEGEEISEEYVLGEVATQTETAIVYNGEVVSTEQALAILLNKVSKIERVLTQ